MNKLEAKGIRAHIDDRNERMNAKIRDAQVQKIPYMFVVGDREIESDEVSVRLRSGENLGSISIVKIIDTINEEISSRS